MKQQEIVIIAITVAVLLVVAAVITTVAGVYTEGFKHDFSHIYVSVGKTKYLSDADIVLGNAQFDVHFVLKKNVGYTVKVLPTGEDFLYSLDGAWMSYASALEDVTKAFDIELGDDSFIIRCRQKSMQEVLEAIYPDSTVHIQDNDIDSSARFKLVVTAGDGSQSIALTFRCLHRIYDFEVDPPSIVI